MWKPLVGLRAKIAGAEFSLVLSQGYFLFHYRSNTTKLPTIREQPAESLVYQLALYVWVRVVISPNENLSSLATASSIFLTTEPDPLSDHTVQLLETGKTRPEGSSIFNLTTYTD